MFIKLIGAYMTSPLETLKVCLEVWWETRVEATRGKERGEVRGGEWIQRAIM